jgi:hypothetical protein
MIETAGSPMLILNTEGAVHKKGRTNYGETKEE